MLGEAGHLFVFVQDEEQATRFERRPVVLGVENDRAVEVVDGLLPGERVVSQGNYSLQYLAPVADETADHEHESSANESHEGSVAPESVPLESGARRGVVVWGLGAVGLLLLGGAALHAVRTRSGRPREVSRP